jgi:hypothetical protein
MKKVSMAEETSLSGVPEQIIFPEIVIDKVSRIRGMDITFVTTAKTDKEAFALLREFGIPFKNQKKLNLLNNGKRIHQRPESAKEKNGSQICRQTSRTSCQRRLRGASEASQECISGAFAQPLQTYRKA